MKKNNKNYTMYWMTGLSAVLTVPIAAVIMINVQAGNLMKTILIVSVFVFLLTAVMLLYRIVYGVSVQEITQEDKVTELDRLGFVLAEGRKKHTNAQLRKNIDIALEQIKRFKRRREVMLQVSGEELGERDGGVLGELVHTVEDALEADIQKIVNRIEIFDDYAMPDLMRQNIGYIEDLLFKINETLIEFERLIAETSRMGETRDDSDISRLRDVISAMQRLRTDQEDEIDDLAKKYENK